MVPELMIQCKLKNKIVIHIQIIHGENPTLSRVA